MLKFLSKQQCLHEDDLDLLWKVTEKVRVFAHLRCFLMCIDLC